ncbi:MAG: hypothetical protein LC731_04020 [Acidobacteria bacterium]|nr:hypothetical protein [Acidobacteriota bacterium]
MRKTKKAARLLLLPFLLLCFATFGFAQSESEGNLRVVASQFKLRDEGVRFSGRKPRSVSHYQPRIVYEGFAYYFSDDDMDGLVAEDLKTGARIIYEPSELALAAGWLKKGERKKEAEDEDISRNNLRGYQRSGNVIWMGTDGYGILAFDTKRKVWARYDSQAQPRPGKDMASIFYADEEYVFAGGFHIYSLKQKRWIKVDSIPTRYVRHFGYSGPYVQLPWSLKKYAKEKFLPLSEYPNSLVLSWPEKVTLRDDGEAYIFEFGREEALTEFTIEKWQIEWAFSQMEFNASPQQSQQ